MCVCVRVCACSEKKAGVVKVRIPRHVHAQLP